MVSDPPFFVTIDFDGTVVDTDITDSVIARYARAGWEEAERLWEEGRIGSRECLSTQMSMIDVPLETVMHHLDDFSVHESFPAFVEFLERSRIPFCIVSDGFSVVIERILANAGLSGIPVHGNVLRNGDSGLVCSFPNSREGCESGTCKCMVSRQQGGGLPVIHIGDGRSDFCLASHASHVFAKGSLADHCRDRKIPHTPFDDFRTVEAGIRALVLVR